MDWLGSWLKSIILVILLATFVDILLPNQTMQRYVKTVMSLFILLTLLNPLFSILQKDITIDGMLAEASHLLSGTNGKSSLTGMFGLQQGGTAEMQTLGNIEQQANQLKARQEQQSQRLMQQQIGDLMKKNIEQTTGVQVMNLTVETVKDTGGQLQISKVNVQAALPSDKSEAAKGETAGSVKPVDIKPVQPVDITIQPKHEPAFGSNKESEEQMDRTTANKVPDNEAGNNRTSQQQTQIKMLLSKEWQVPMAHISVEVTASDGKTKY